MYPDDICDQFNEDIEFITTHLKEKVERLSGVLLKILETQHRQTHWIQTLLDRKLIPDEYLEEITKLQNDSIKACSSFNSINKPDLP